jgi:hypothetical protein
MLPYLVCCVGWAMSALDLEYYKRRLDDERNLVRTAASSEIAELHEELARLYEKMINALDVPPPETA